MAKRKRRREISMRKVREVLRLSLKYQRSNRQIARSCCISRATVARYVLLAKEVGLSRLLQRDKAPLKRKSYAMPDWNYIHTELKKKNVTLELLWQEYKGVYPDGYQSTQFCELYRRWRKKLNPSLYQVHKAGEKMFVDYAGHTVPIVDRLTGKFKEAEVFAAVLGASNYTYSEATWDQGLVNWIGSHIRAFEYFNGVTRITVPDNLKAGVSKSCRYEPDINPAYHDMAIHYGTAVIPARVARPKDKAKVEVGIQVVERWILAALRNRTFFSLSELNQAIRELLVKLNERPFKKLEGTRKNTFEKIEKEALLALPEARYVFAEWKKARVNIDYHIELLGHYYSVPYSLVGEEITVRYTAKTVEAFLKGKRVASHIRDDSRGRHTTIREHMPKSHREYLEWSPSRIIRWAHSIGEATAGVIEIILNSRRYPEQGYRSSMGILRLAKRYSNARLEAACKRALAIRGYSYKSIESILKNGLDLNPLSKQRTQPAVKHENIRGSNYFTSGYN